VTGRAAWRPPLVCLLLALLLSGCGVRAQDRPEPLVVPGSPSPGVTSSPSAGASAVRVYFVRGSRLEAVERSAPDAASATVLDLLTAGPSRPEVLGGLRTAVAPTALVSRDARVVGSTVEVVLAREFTAVSGSNQLLAVAQVVWTLTERPGVTAVRFSAAGTPIEVPTDAGLTDQPVDRDDYRSVGAPEPTPSGPSGTAPSSPR
jgi:hypothetical protein